MKTNGGAPVNDGSKGRFAKLRHSIPLLAMVVLVVFSNVGLVQAAVFTVDRLDDDAAATACDDATPNDCSLRGAVSHANAAGPNVIVLPAGTYALSVASPCTFIARRGENFLGATVALCLNSDVTISGAGSDKTVIQGNGVDRVIASSVSKTVSISGITVTRGGPTPFGFQIGGGGGILNHGTLMLSDSILTANAAGNSGGGGVFNFGTLTISSTLIANNSASGLGGGIVNSGDAGAGVLNIQNSTISDNITLQQGGGLVNIFSGVVTVTGSTVSGNMAVGEGGGIYNASFCSLMVTNSTITNNQSDAGGGIANAFRATTDLHNVTLTANTVGTASNGRGIGGGASNGGTLTLRNTIVAGNTTHNLAPDCSNFQGSGDFISRGYNLIQNTAGCYISGDATGNIIGQDPQLGLLTDNGGPTKTRAPAELSPVIDAGNPEMPGSGVGNACAVIDQRGFVRPLGAVCDIGAFERSGAFSLTRVLPNIGGNTGSVSAVVSGDGVARGATVKLTRAGQTDVVGEPIKVDAGGSAIAATFDLAGKPLGPWNVVVTNPDGATKTLLGGFTVEEGRAPKLWVDVVGRFFRPGRASRLTIVYGNRGNVDAIGVPLSLSIPEGYAPRRFFAIAPPPVQAGQVRDDFSQVPVAVDFLGEASHFVQIPLLLPVVPAGFTGTLQIGLTLPPGAQDSFLVTSIGDPLFNPALDPEAVSLAVAGAQTYLQSFGVTVPATLVPALAQYVTGQFQRVAESGRVALINSLGTEPQIYSMAQLHLDLALYGAASVASGPTTSTQSHLHVGWLDATYRHLAFLGVTILDGARQRVGQLTDILYRSVVVALSWLGPTEAFAQKLDCPVHNKGDVLPEECSGNRNDEPFLPPGVPLPFACDLQDFRTFRHCLLTPDACELLPGYKVVKGKNGNPFCVPKKPEGNCAKIATPVGVNAGCMIFPLRPQNSVDPNDKAGSLGVTSAQFLLEATPLSYTVFFENLNTATAAAQEVAIFDQLDMRTMDFETFRLGPISIGRDITLIPAPGTQQYSGGIDLRPEKNLIVAITAGLDKSTGLLSWLFTSIDPDTGQFTEDPNAGFLPPNVNSPEGEGSVGFMIEAKKGPASGTIICNQARIVFDVNAAIATPQWCNTIDTAPPASQVSLLAAIQSSLSFPVRWSGSDLGSGIVDYTIFVSKNGGAFTPFLADTPDTSATFTGLAGNSYAFYSVARDAVGNLEGAPQIADATTTIAVVAPGIPGDVNSDGRVDCGDLSIIKASFGKRSGQTGFDPRADVNTDGIVDVRDLAFVAQRVSPATKCA